MSPERAERVEKFIILAGGVLMSLASVAIHIVLVWAGWWTIAPVFALPTLSLAQTAALWFGVRAFAWDGVGLAAAKQVLLKSKPSND